MKNIRYNYGLTVPAATMYTIFFVIPLIMGLYFSFTDWSIYSNEINFIGFEQFKIILTNHSLLNALMNSLKFALVHTVLRNVIGLLLALAVNYVLVFKRTFRMILFSPVIMSSMVVAYIFIILLHPDGLVNRSLEALNLQFLSFQWLADPRKSIFVIAIISVWQMTGINMAIYLAGLQGVPGELIEVSRIEGAGKLKTFIYVTFPLIAPTFTINVVLTIINSLQIFDLVFILTGGGPGESTEVMSTFVYKQFGRGYYGLGTAGNLVLAALICLIAFTTLGILKKREAEL